MNNTKNFPDTRNDILTVSEEAEDCKETCQKRDESGRLCGKKCTKVKIHSGSHFCPEHGSHTDW
jgi:hypothetical protein